MRRVKIEDLKKDLDGKSLSKGSFSVDAPVNKSDEIWKASVDECEAVFDLIWLDLPLEDHKELNKQVRVAVVKMKPLALLQERRHSIFFFSL